MAIYKLTKTFRGGKKVYYIELETGEAVEDEMLESIGNQTPGGELCGYTITYQRISRLPKGAKILPRERTVRVY